jgi:hypothetical protein
MQFGSSLYERLGLSRNKDKVMALANKGQTVENPHDIFKTPYVLEFTLLERRQRIMTFGPTSYLLAILAMTCIFSYMVTLHPQR